MGKVGADEFLLRLAKDAAAYLPAEFSKELGLTGREGEVLSWLSKGKSNRDIAQILGLSPRTVDKHLEQIYAKLGVENRTAAAAIAVNASHRKSSPKAGTTRRNHRPRTFVHLVPLANRAMSRSGASPVNGERP
jgi:DNA-binding CsgD family transcriptional regulator